MGRRASALTILALISLCAVLGMFESAGSVLSLTPFLLLVLPLLAGFDPSGPVADAVASLLADHPAAGKPAPGTGAAASLWVRSGRIAGVAIGSRAPPQPATV